MEKQTLAGQGSDFMDNTVKLSKEALEPIWVQIGKTKLDGEKCLQVYKTEKLDEHDIDSMAKLKDLTFHNGIIEVQVRSRLLPDAPDYARGFIGIAFRIAPDNAKFEAFYIRPANGTSKDPVRKAHGCQYFTYPEYTYQYYREHGIEGCEASCDIALDEWIPLRVEIVEETARFYVQDMDFPVLVIENLKLGADAKGQIGLFVDTGTEGYFKDLKIVSYD